MEHSLKNHSVRLHNKLEYLQFILNESSIFLQAMVWPASSTPKYDVFPTHVTRRKSFRYDGFLFNFNFSSLNSLTNNRLFGNYRPTREFFFHLYEDVTITVEGLQILTYAWHSWPLSSEGSLTCHTHCGTGHRFIMAISEDPWHSHLLPRV